MIYTMFLVEIQEALRVSSIYVCTSEKDFDSSSDDGQDNDHNDANGYSEADFLVNVYMRMTDENVTKESSR